MKQTWRWKSFVSAIVLIIWVVWVIALYWVVHRPWTPTQGLAPFKAVLDVVFALLLTGLAGGLGRRLSYQWFAPQPLEGLALQAGLGFGVLGLGTLAAGLAGWLHPWAGWLALLVGWLLLFRDVLAWARPMRSLFADYATWTRLERFSLGFVGLLLGLNFFWALAPPVRWDSLVYHLELPKMYVAAGRVYFTPLNLYGGFPQLVEMLFSWAMLLGSANTALVLNWAAGAAALIGVEGFCRRAVGGSTRWLAPAFLLSGSSLAQALHWGYVDLWVMLFGLGVLVALDTYRLTAARQWLALAGIMAGFSIGVKYTAGVVLLVGLILLLPFWDRAVGRKDPSEDEQAAGGSPGLWKRLGRMVREGLILGGIAFLAASPWLGKNLVFAGNPLYPLGLSTGQIDPWRQTFQGGLPVERSLWQDILLPVDVTLYGIEGKVVLGKPEYGANIGPLLLALIPALFFGWRALEDEKKRFYRFLLIAAASTWLIWAAAAHIQNELSYPRHYYGLFPILALLAAAGFDATRSLRFSQVRVQNLLSALVILSLALVAIVEGISFFVERNPLPVLTGYQSTADYVQDELGWYGQAMQAVNKLPAEASVYSLWEPRVYYCQVQCITDATLHNWWYLRRAYGGAEQIGAELRQKGVTHVLIYDYGMEMLRTGESEYDAADWVEFDGFVQTQLVEVQKMGGVYSLYALAAGGANENP